MFVCPELIEEPGRFRELILGISGQNSPPPLQQVEVSGRNVSHLAKLCRNFRFSGSEKIHIKPYHSHPSRVKNLKFNTSCVSRIPIYWSHYISNIAYSLSYNDVIINFHIGKLRF